MNGNELLLLPRCKKDQGTAVEHSRPYKDAESEKTQRKGVDVVLRVKKNPGFNRRGME